MRKRIREQMVELISTIWEGVKQARAMEPRTAESVLTDCYLAVKSVEQALQNGLSPEAFSQYTDVICTIKQHLEGTNEGIARGAQVADITKMLKTELKKLRKMLLEEKEVKLEVVFFPYKASMWDAMESVWKAACEDESCNAYVVPIPYYDRLPNGALGAMHYEGGQYPKDVPIVKWEEYDAEKRRPDAIFIHNPYDEGNLVTSVHPDYYSKRLRDCTGMLVYLPYFVVCHDVQEHFCTTAGCIYAHKTFVQSERVCETYIKAFGEAYGNRFGSPKEKFMPLGSPKFDKVLKARREDYTLPLELRELIEGKKVVLYNTSIGALLQDSERYLEKLKSVLRFFEERDDLALWWRPHPLLLSTLSSMRPALAEAYREMVEEYRHKAYRLVDEGQEING